MGGGRAVAGSQEARGRSRGAWGAGREPCRGGRHPRQAQGCPVRSLRVPVVFEKLAAQLREPVFREAESGYDPDDVRGFLDELAARLAVLEERVDEAETVAYRAERRLKKARKFARASGALGVDTSILDEVVMDGQREAQELLLRADAEKARLAAEAEARVAAAKQSVDLSGVRAQIEERRADVARQQELGHALAGNLDAAAQAVRTSRDEILAGIDQQLRELKEARL